MPWPVSRPTLGKVCGRHTPCVCIGPPSERDLAIVEGGDIERGLRAKGFSDFQARIQHAEAVVAIPLEGLGIGTAHQACEEVLVEQLMELNRIVVLTPAGP